MEEEKGEDLGGYKGVICFGLLFYGGIHFLSRNIVYFNLLFLRGVLLLVT